MTRVRVARRLRNLATMSTVFVSLLAVAACLTLGACSSEEPQTGSQTNWLKSCNSSADCGDLDCVCGTCTVACETTESCSELTPGECINTGDRGAVALCNGLTPEESLCLQRCNDAECPNGSQCIAGICSPAREPSVRIEIDPSTTAQELIGLGASVAYDGDAIIAHPEKSALYDAMFSDSGLDIIRLRVRFNGDNPQVLAEATELVAEAQARMETPPLVFLASSSPPPNLKANGIKFCPQLDPNCTLTRAADGGFDYAGFADYWRSTLEAYETAGVVPDFVSIQNNPDWLPPYLEGGEACRFLPEEGTISVTLADGTTVDAEFPGYQTALRAVRAAIAPLGRTYSFVAPDSGNLAALTPYTDVLEPGSYEVIGYHLFGNAPPYIPFGELEDLKAVRDATGVPHMQTEMGANGLGTAVLLHHTFVTAGGSAYIQNQFVSQGIDQNGTSPIGSDAETFELQPPYHALAHYARSTEPGWLLAGATASGEEPEELEGVLASAWVSPDASELTIVVVNQADSYSDVLISAPPDWEAALTEANVTRTVFNGIERSADLGKLPPDRVLRIPGRSVVTITATSAPD